MRINIGGVVQLCFVIAGACILGSEYGIKIGVAVGFLGYAIMPFLK